MTRSAKPPSFRRRSATVGCACGDRKRHRDGRSQAFAGTLGAHDSAMEFGEMFDECQPDTEAPVTARRRTVSLSKPLEHVRQHMRGDTLAGVSNDKFHFVHSTSKSKPDLTFRGSEFNGAIQ